ncbi:MAG TPA: squalene synthase HpnC [Rhizomicrobium sp.]|nr:squalene synthase HpnC [Rhizomicrobium sp.]
MSVKDLASGKDYKDENFPVASVLLAKKHRAPIMAFYNFARAADDVADNAEATPDEKLKLLDEMERTLMGERDVSYDAHALRLVLDKHEMSPQHPLMLLEAFRRDVTKKRYADWDDLMDYCRYSAMPVGRFVLDVHGESRETWPANDALCAALQVINHLQDCAKDYRELDRVYLPLDVMETQSMAIGVLSEPKATPGLRAVLAELGRRTARLLDQSRPFARQIRDRRLSLEVSVIQTLAEDLNSRLLVRDPLSERVHHRRFEMPGLLLRAVGRFAAARLGPKRDGIEARPVP